MSEGGEVRRGAARSAWASLCSSAEVDDSSGRDPDSGPTPVTGFTPRVAL